MSKVTPFLMFNDQLEAAIAFYTATFRDSEIRKLSRGGQDGPITSAEFVVGGQVFMGYDGGPHFAFSEGCSLFVDCEDQAEVDRYWDKLLGAGAKPSQCGWITDPFGVTGQIVPRRFMELIGDQNPRKVQGVMAATMKMVKLDVATNRSFFISESAQRIPSQHDRRCTADIPHRCCVFALPDNPLECRDGSARSRSGGDRRDRGGAGRR